MYASMKKLSKLPARGTLFQAGFTAPKYKTEPPIFD